MTLHHVGNRTIPRKNIAINIWKKPTMIGARAFVSLMIALSISTTPASANQQETPSLDELQKLIDSDKKKEAQERARRAMEQERRKLAPEVESRRQAIEAEVIAEAVSGRMQGSCVGMRMSDSYVVTKKVSTIIFSQGDAALKQEFHPALDKISASLRTYDVIVAVIGHTDELGSDITRQQLSERRAEIVGNYLIKQGLSPERACIVGLSSRYPIANNSLEDGRIRNNRVEICFRSKNQGC